MKKIARAISEIRANKISFYFFISHTSRAQIGLKFGTLKGLIKADLCTNFGRNPMNIHGVMTDYLCKIRSKVCHAYRVNSFEQLVENYYVDGATIVGVPFCGLKGIGIKTTEI